LSLDLFYKLELLNDSLNKLQVSLREIDYLKTKLNLFLFLRVLSNTLIYVILSIIEIPFYIFILPCMAYLDQKSEKERLKRLAESSVKHKALDIVSSYKIMEFIKLWPLFYLYTLI